MISMLIPSFIIGINAQITEQQQQSFIEKAFPQKYSCSVFESTNLVILGFFGSDSELCSEYAKSIVTLKSNGFHIAAANNYLIFMEK
jgi:hypothetical protein